MIWMRGHSAELLPEGIQHIALIMHMNSVLCPWSWEHGCLWATPLSVLSWTCASSNWIQMSAYSCTACTYFAYVTWWGKMFIGKSVTWVDWNTRIIFDLDVITTFLFSEKHLWTCSSLDLVIIGLGNHCVSPMAGEGWPGILFRRSEESSQTEGAPRRPMTCDDHWPFIQPSNPSIHL